MFWVGLFSLFLVLASKLIPISPPILKTVPRIPILPPVTYEYPVTSSNSSANKPNATSKPPLGGPKFLFLQ